MKAKGAHVLNAVKVLRSDKARARTLLPPALHKYLDERILPSSWYPIADHRLLLQAVANLLGGVSDASWIIMGRGVAQMDLAGIYRPLLRPGDAESSLRMMSAMWKNAFDTGEVKVAVDGPGRVTIALHDFPVRDGAICAICGGYIVEIVTQSIGVEPHVVQERCRARNDHECVWRVQWQPPPRA